MILRLSFFSLLLLGSWSSSWAQGPADNLFIEGPQQLCLGECATWYVFSSGTVQASSYQWLIQSGGVGGPSTVSDTLITTTGELFWCPPVSGVYRITVTAMGPNGTVLFISQPAVVFVSEVSVVFYTATFMVASDCERDTVTIFYPQEEPACMPVCVGHNSSVTLLDIFGGYSDGSTFSYPSSTPSGFGISWSAFGGTLTYSANTAQVLWDTPGSGFVQVNLLTFPLNSNSPCPTFVSPSLCFDVQPIPEASITTQPPADSNSILTVCEGQSIDFDGEAGIANASLAWDFGDGSVASGANASHTFASAGVYEVQLVAASGCMCSDTTYLTVIVTGNETPFVDCVATICAGETVTYTANTGCTSYLWDVSAHGLILSGGGPTDDFVTVQWQSGPEGIISLATDGCPDLSTCTETAFLSIPILDDLAEISGRERVCAGERVVYSITPFEGTTFNWTVSNFGIIESGQGTPTITVLWQDLGFIPGTPQSVQVTYNNCYLDCGGSDELVVNMLPLFLTDGPIEVCEGESATFNAFNQNGSGLPVAWSVLSPSGTVLWTGPVSASEPIPFNFGAGQFVVRASPPAAAQVCNDYIDQNIRVYGMPAPVDSIVGQRRICAGQNYVYRVHDAAPGDRFVWDINDGGTLSTLQGNPITYNWGASGLYSISVRRQQRPPLNCTSLATTLNLSAVGTFSVNGPTDACKDDFGTYTSTLSGDVNYQWSIVPASAGTITGSSTDASIEVLWHESGPAQVVLSVCGQSANTAVQVHDLPSPAVNHPLALCPGQTAMLSTTSLFSAYSWQDTAGLVLATTPGIVLGPGYYQLQVTDSNGCIGNATFNMGEYPAASIYITTPDFTIYCAEPPSAHLFAPNTDAGLSYEWLQNGTPVGSNSPDYVASALGVYQLRVVDNNGCEALSNTIELLINCGGGGGGGAPGGGAGCNNPAQSFATLPGAFCNERSYVANAAGATGFDWNFDEPASGLNNFSTLANPTHTYTRPGFYRVLLTATYAGGAVCRTIIPDTVLAAADFTYAVGCVGTAMDFSDISSFLPLTSITGWSWTFGDPASGSADTAFVAQPSHTYTSAGDYTVTLTISTANGCQSRISKVIKVLPLPAVNFNDPVVNCEATALPFDALPMGELSFNWTFGEPASGEANSSQQVNSFHAYAAPGSYQVTLSGTDVFGCTNTLAKTVSVTPNLLSGDISPNGMQVLCEGDSLTLTAPAGGLAWAWSNGAVTEQTIVHEAGIYTLVLTGAAGCSYTPPAVSVQVVPAPVAPIRAIEFNANGQRVAYVYDTLSVCFGQDVFLETPLQAGYNWQWSTGDVINSVSFTTDRNNLLSVGEHIVTLQTTDLNTGCTVLERFVVVVHPAPDAPILTTNAPMPWCAGTPIDIQVSNVQAGVTYLWSNGSTGNAIQTDEGGTYTALALTPFGCQAESNEISIIDGPNTSLVPSGCHTRCTPDTICLPTIPNIVSYQWFMDGAPMPGGNSPELIVNQGGSYTLEMTDINGCTQMTDPLSLTLEPGFGHVVGQVFFDVNENGLIDAGDSLVAGIPLVLYPAGGSPDTTISTTTGDYGFSNIPANTYTVQVDSLQLPSGWRAYVTSVDTVLTGCDVEIVLPWLLYLNCNSDSSLMVQVCANETFIYQGQTLLPGSSTNFTFTSATGCDSIVTVTVQALPTSSSTWTLTACPGSTATYQGQSLAIGSSTNFTLTGANGCDSIVTINVQALPTSSSTWTLTACPGSTATYLGQSLAIGSSTNFTLTGANGCDSIVTINVQALPTSSSTWTLTACPGSTATYQGQSLAIGSSTNFTLTGANGCDSIVTINVQALPTSSSNLTLSACPGSTATYQGQSLTIGSSTNFTLTGANGCDSIVTVTVQALTPSATALNEVVCPSESYTYLGINFPAGTDTTFLFTNAQGCDSLVSLRVTASATAMVSIQTTDACPNQANGSISITPSSGLQPLSYALDGLNFQLGTTFMDLSAGNYQLSIEDSEGCVFSQALQVDAQAPLVATLEDALLPCDGNLNLAPIIVSGDDGQLQYSWTDGNFPTPRPVSSSGSYEVEISNTCESVRLQTQVTPERSIESESLIYVPNAFSPNADGSNDEFRFFPAEDVVLERVSLRIFDRWGELVYQSDNASSAWNGQLRRQLLDQAVFIWILEADVVLCGQRMPLKKQGEVVLLK